MPRESEPERKRRAGRIARALARAYPDARCALRFDSPFQLLIATILSAQCTDQKVNEVTRVLFARYPDAAALADADPAQIEASVRPTGFYRQKTKSILATARQLVEQHGGAVPKTLAELTALRGVARKTANVVLGTAFGIPGIAVDTHMTRVNQRLALTREEDPVRIEQDLMRLLPESEWTLYTHRVIHHGRVCCDARRPRCETCPLRPECPWPGSAQARSSKPGGRKPSRARKAAPRKQAAR